MTNTCPSCGALYNVAAKDIGRRLRCKKCNSALRVTEAGLEVEEGAPPREDDDRADGAEGAEDEPRPAKKKARAERGPGLNPAELLVHLPTALFAAGVFLVIVFISLPLIGDAGSNRAAAGVQRLENDRKREEFDLKPKKPQAEWSDAEKKKIEDELPKINARYSRLIEDANLDAERARISNVRDRWLEGYGLMFGFILVSFGCIGYLRTEQHLVVKILAAVILTLMMLVMFMKFTGCAAPR